MVMNMKTYSILLFLTFLFLGNISAQDVELSVDSGEGYQGEIVCVDVSVDNFIDIAVFEFALAFDSTVLEIVSLELNKQIPSDTFPINASELVDIDNEIRLIGFKSIFSDNKNNYSFPNGSSRFYTVCFRLIGEPGEMGRLDFSYAANKIAFQRDTSSTVENNSQYTSLSYNLTNGKITILPDDTSIAIMSSACDAIVNQDNGAISFAATAGKATQGPYSWRIYDGSGTIESGTGLTGMAENLTPGTYFIEVRDSNGNSETKEITLMYSPEITLDVTTIPLTCPSSTSGGFDVTSPTNLYYVRWESPEHNIVKYSKSVRGPAGTYLFYAVHKETGCEHVFEYELTSPPPFEILNLQATRQCSYSPGVVSGTYAGGSVDTNNGEFYDVDAYYIDENGNEVFLQSIDGWDFNINVNPDVRQVVVKMKDTPGCRDDIYVNIPVPEELQADTLMRVSCNGNEAIVVPPNGANYTYSWSHNGGETGSMAVVTGTTTTTVRITNEEGCIRDITFQFDIDISGNTNFNAVGTAVSCFGGSDGSAILTVDNTSEWDIKWYSDAELTQELTQFSGQFSASGLTSGLYYVQGYNTTIGCFLSSEVVIGSSQAIELQVIDITEESCDGNDGSIRVVASGGPSGNPLFNYSINNGSNMTSSTGVIFSGLTEGQYLIEAIDVSGCSEKTDSIEVESAAQVSLDLDEAQTYAKSCNREFGQLAVNVNGGQPPFTFNWTRDGVSFMVTSDSILTNLDIGVYSVSVTDSEGCYDKLDESLTVTQVETIDFDVTYEEPECHGETTCLQLENVTGGSGSNYSVQLIGGNVRPIDDCVEVFGGTYSLVVIDGDNCRSEEREVVVTQPEAIYVDAGEDISIKLGETTDIISLEILADADSIIWSPETYLEFLTDDKQVVQATPADDIEYIITLVDTDGCRVEDRLFIDVNKSRRIPTANIFSPNGDGKDDFFSISLPPSVSEVSSFKIYDRFGGQVFLEENVVPLDGVYQGWDGKVNNSFVNPGVYVWLATYTYIDGSKDTKSGSITVVR